MNSHNHKREKSSKIFARNLPIPILVTNNHTRKKWPTYLRGALIECHKNWVVAGKASWRSWETICSESANSMPTS